jgi:hypothetical protein
MGQSQLLLIIIVLIIVGIAVAVGITNFGEGAAASNRDAVGQDCLTIISKALVFYNKPLMQGGGSDSFNGSGGVTLAKLGVQPANDNGSYELVIDSDDQVTCTGTGYERIESGENVEVTVTYNASTKKYLFSDNMAGSAGG